MLVGWSAATQTSTNIKLAQHMLPATPNIQISHSNVMEMKEAEKVATQNKGFRREKKILACVESGRC